MRANVRGHYCVTSVYEKDHFGKASTGQWNTQRGNSSHTRLDTEVPHARRVGEEETPILIRLLVLTSWHDITTYRKGFN